MGKREDYEAKTEKLIMPIVEANNVELFDVDYIKEGQDWYLRVYIDKEGGITVDDCEVISRLLGEWLDKEDFIEDSYIMEISSPGLDRPLKKEKDFVRSMGKLVEIRTYRPIEKQKEFCGILNAYDRHTVIIICGEYSVKFPVSLDRTVCPDFQLFSHASLIVFLFFQRTSKARGADLHDIGVIDKVLCVQPVRKCTADDFAVIYGNSAFFVDVSTQVPGTALFDILHIHQFKTIGFYNRSDQFFCLLFVFFSSAQILTTFFDLGKLSKNSFISLYTRKSGRNRPLLNSHLLTTLL